MFLAVTLLLTLLEISFGRRNPRPRARARPRPGRHFKGGLNDAFHGTREYLNSYSYEETYEETYGETYGKDCDKETYDCENYSYEGVEPPSPATQRPATAATPAPVKPNLLANFSVTDPTQKHLIVLLIESIFRFLIALELVKIIAE